MTNKKFRDDLAKEMRDKYNERNEKLEQAEKSSFSSGLKEQMKKEIMDNFTKEMDEMKSRPWYEDAKKTHLEEIKSKIWVNAAKKEKERLQKEYEEKLAKADEDIADKNKAYEDAKIAHRWEVEQKITKNSDNKEKSEIPQDLKDFREAWEERINRIANASKEKIIKAAEQIPVKVEIDNDGSRLIEFKLWNKTYKILDPKLKTHSEDKYIYNPDYNSIKHIDDTVLLGWMRWDDVEKWENKKLKEYVKEKQWEWLHIAKIEEMRDLLNELWKEANLKDKSDKIAMLMYLTWMDWCYRLSMWDNEHSNSQEDSRSLLKCNVNRRLFLYNDFANLNASLCMIACQ